MRNSLKNLLDMFPYFFNKRETSNFYKSQRVTNNLFKDVYQALFDTKESFRLNKRCLIWKEQSRPYDYTIHFVANFPFIKEVNILKDDVLIYSNSYEYEENMNEFNYDYTSSTLNDVEDIDDGRQYDKDDEKVVEEFTELTRSIEEGILELNDKLEQLKPVGKKLLHKKKNKRNNGDK